MTYDVNHFINGKNLPRGESKLSIMNPATGKEVGFVNIADQTVVNEAVCAAASAFPSWSKEPPIKRARVLFKMKELLEKNIHKLAEVITREHGKTLSDAKNSVQRGIDVVEFVCGIPQLLKSSFSENVASGIDCYSIRQPLGVCVGITPFNFPAMIPLWMFPMAIACGNTFVLKPSEKDPSSSCLLAEIAKEAGLPDGVLNVVQGDKSTVDALLNHQDVKAISFVGSTLAAESVYQTATRLGKRVQAFGGAKNHCVVMPDADLKTAADALVGAAYGSAGERCMAISVAVAVGDQVADTLIETIKQQLTHLKIGPGKDDVDMGPLVTREHCERVVSYIDLGVQEGAKLIVDGRKYSAKEGFFLGASLFDEVTPNMRIYREEIFGPVLLIVRVENLESAIKMINEHEYGNGTAIFTREGFAARKFVNEVQVGMVGVNIPIPVPAAFHSFGGWKRSFFGDIAMHGDEGVRFFTKLKTVTERWLHEIKENVQYTMPTH